MKYLVTMVSGRKHAVWLPKTNLTPLYNELMQIRMRLESPGEHSLEVFTTEKTRASDERIALNINHIESITPIY